jgi:hypothetical protein
VNSPEVTKVCNCPPGQTCPEFGRAGAHEDWLWNYPARRHTVNFLGLPAVTLSGMRHASGVSSARVDRSAHAPCSSLLARASQARVVRLLAARGFWCLVLQRGRTRGRTGSVAAEAMLAVTTAPAAVTAMAAAVMTARRQARRVGLDMETSM